MTLGTVRRFSGVFENTWLIKQIDDFLVDDIPPRQQHARPSGRLPTLRILEADIIAMRALSDRFAVPV